MRKKRVLCLIFTPIVVMLLFGYFWYFKHSENVQYIGSSETISLPLEHYMLADPNKPLDTGIWQLAAKVNGIECRLILDTGASHSALSKDFCRRHSLTGKKILANPFTSNVKDGQLFKVNVQLEVGKVKLAESSFIAMNLEHWADDALVPLAGILGSDFLNKYIYSINMRDGILGIIREADYDKNAGVEMPIAIRNNHVYFNLDIKGKTVEFLLDSGRYVSDIDESDFANLKGKYEKYSGSYFDINSTYLYEGQKVTLTGIKFGPAIFTNAEFRLSDENIIGVNVLKWVNVVVNPLTKCMILTPSNPPSIDGACKKE
jgi:predicted aspartyl protease